MRVVNLIASMACSLVLACAALAQTAPAPAAKPQAPATPPTVSTILDRQLSGLEREFVSAAEAMPEDKFNFAPTNGEFKGVRTFALQIKHVAATNLVIAAGLLQEKPSFDPLLENGPENITGKDAILKMLRESFAQAHKAMATINEKNTTEMISNPWNPQRKVSRLGLAIGLVPHAFDHYGQMVEYLRMNGIIPPASRR